LSTIGAIQRPDDAEIDQADHLAGQDQQVARMRVSMEVTVDQHFFDDGLGGVRGNAITVVACGDQRRVVVDLDAADAFLNHDVPGGVLPVDLGRVDVFFLGKVGAEAVSIARLAR